MDQKESNLLLPERVRKREISLARYVLSPYGLAFDSVGDVIIDNCVALIQPHREPDLYLCPLVPNPQPDISRAWFYADCIAYDHDMPVIVQPTEADIRRFGFRYIYTGVHRPREVKLIDLDKNQSTIIKRQPLSEYSLAKLFFNNQLNNILNEIREMRHGPLTCIIFRHDGWHGRINLPYTDAYARVSKEIHLYATALRQADTLSEFLSYYRVIESASNSNGKSWISYAIPILPGHKFDNISISFIDELETANLLSIYRRRALHRLRVLLNRCPSPSGVADYLYKVNRCGIAHGRNIIRSDIVPSYFEMIRDTYLIKLLARMAIDEKLGASRIVSTQFS